MITYDTPGTTTWFCPIGVTSITLKLWGGGGSGNTYLDVYASGGGGAFVQTTAIPVEGGTTYNITVGQGGQTSNGLPSSFSLGDNIFVSASAGTIINGGPASSGAFVSLSSAGGNGVPTADYF